MWKMTRVFVALMMVLLSMAAHAQCVNSSQPSCKVYESCFAKECNCTGKPSEYFLSYGKKYCEVFLDLPGLSPAGRQWRDATLRCLQETIVPRLPATGQPCNCDAMQTYAYDSHVQCYTQKKASICALPKEDWYRILMAVDPRQSFMDEKGRKQMVAVARMCLPELVGDAKKHAQEIINKLKP